MSVNWYDILGLDREASLDEISEAWRSAVDGLTPSDPTFSVFNQAYEVLSDPVKRGEHDQTLGSGDDAATSGDASGTDDETPGSREPDASVVSDETDADKVDTAAASGTSDALGEPAETPTVRAPRVTSGAGKPAQGKSSQGQSNEGLGAAFVAAVLVLGVLSTAVWVGWAIVSRSPSTAAVGDARAQAEASAVQAAQVIFAYDYERLDADRAAASAHLTGDQLEEYDRFMTGTIAPNAAELQIKVTIDVKESAVVRVGADQDRDRLVDVLVMFDQQTSRGGTTDPAIAQNYATLTMVHEDDDWLVSDIKGPPVADVGQTRATPSPSPNSSPSGQPTDTPAPSATPRPGADANDEPSSPPNN